MVDRSDIMAELGLTPTWRLRARSVEPVASGREAQSDRVPQIAPESARVAAAETPESRPPRELHIAKLEWQDFAADVDACTACGLSATRKRSVPGVGDVKADWMFVGEAPGVEEDAKGEPFVGQAGRLLDNMLAALGLKRGANVYIANVLKCRPPNNRTPEP